MAEMAYVPTYISYLKVFEDLSDEEFGRIVRASLQYLSTGEIPELSRIENVSFRVMKEDIDRAAENYNAKCETNRINGAKGGRPPKNQSDEKSNGFLENPKNPTVFSETEKTQRKSKSKSKSNSNSNFENDIAANAADTPAKEKKPRKTFTPPTVDEVKAYCDECGYNTIDPDAFIDYYAANGWKVGSQAMKDWKATVRNWARRDRERGITSRTQSKEERDPMLEYLDRVINGEA